MDEAVTTELGPVCGSRADGVARFHAVPYGEAPIGERRFLPPQPHGGWKETLDARHPGEPPAQRSGWVPKGSLNEERPTCFR